MFLTDIKLPVIAAAIIGSLVVIVFSAVLIWKCKTRKRFSHQDPHQAIPTAENNTDPDLQDVCYTYLDISQLSKGGAIKPVVTFTPNWGNILHYDDVTLTCDVPFTVPEEPRTYQWYKDRRPIPGDQQRLHITSSRVEDRGDYQCQTIGGDISDPVFLNVTENFVILQRPPFAIYEGDPLTLRCHNWRFYNAINKKFYKDDQEVKSSESDSTFHIPNIMMSQSGLYKCTKEFQRKDSPYVMERSDEFFISVKGK
ncbi:low affinity immunoglobulin gamma Fc region receptor III-B-like [Aquarana catesbeiana]|uniref:low affinity immunoglobulin gamma Fc region receptor III-B-like n=1 Tax=Aquarana catesbeiana TaxID=8400 RepID=UPI003CCA5645